MKDSETVGASCNDADVDIMDALEFGWRLSGRSVRRLAALLVLCLMISCPAAGAGVLMWVANHRAEQIQHQMERILPPPQPTPHH
jgi:hypothetical protein